MIEELKHKGRLYALILRANYKADGIEFFTPNEFSQQLAYMRRPRGYLIKPHVHNSVTRTVEYTKEVLYIKSGSVRVDFYDDQQKYLVSKEIKTGDVILLAFGGHGFHMLEESEIIEIKQGPYAGEMDKTRFEPIDDSQMKLE
ncbi:MAG: hypothetical protein ACKN9V_10855 [Pseudomonadota bacterium]